MVIIIMLLILVHYVEQILQHAHFHHLQLKYLLVIQDMVVHQIV